MALDNEWFEWRFRRTKRVEGGIKARAAKFGETWWASRWLDVLRDSGSRNRLTRGRTYARKGQITEFAVRPGKISATVQGSASQPYEVEIRFVRVEKEPAERILREMQRSPLFAARLLNQEMPAEVVKLFETQEQELYPTSLRALQMDCTCPDEARICKHIAAVLYLFSLQLERDPLLLLEFRGIDRHRLMSEVRTDHLFAPIAIQPKAELLPADPIVFWRGSRIPASSLHSEPPKQNAALIKQLGNFPLWRGENDFFKILEAVYAAATTRAQQFQKATTELEES